MKRVIIIGSGLGGLSCGVILAKNGYHVVEAENGKQALELTQTDNFDLIVTDVKMPEMTGVEFLSSIRQSGSQTPVILCTGFSDTSEEDCRRMGANQVLVKPVKRKTLLAEIEQLLKD